MTSLILQTATRVLHPLLLLYSVFLLSTGHNGPGGGFVGGLVAASAFALYGIAHDTASARRLLKADPLTVTAVGLAVALASGVPGLLSGRPFLTGVWADGPIGGVGGVVVGTPLVFDTGVYLVVVGVTLLMILNLAEA